MPGENGPHPLRCRLFRPARRVDGQPVQQGVQPVGFPFDVEPRIRRAQREGQQFGL